MHWSWAPPRKKNEELFILVIGLVVIGRTVKQSSDLKTSSIGARGHTGERRPQRQRPPPAVMKTSSFPVHLCLTRVAITPLIWGIFSCILACCLLLPYQLHIKTWGQCFAHMWYYLNVFFMALSKKSGLFSSRNQGVPRWPTYTWLAKLLMRDRVTSVRVPLYLSKVWKPNCHVFHFWLFCWYCSFAMCIPVRNNIHGSVAFPVLLPFDIENPHHYWNVVHR